MAKTSAASGLFTAGATWVGGVAPVAAETWTIANTHVVYCDADMSGTSYGAGTVNVGGTFDMRNGGIFLNGGNITIAGKYKQRSTSTLKFDGLYYLSFSANSTVDINGDAAANLSETCIITNNGGANWAGVYFANYCEAITGTFANIKLSNMVNSGSTYVGLTNLGNYLSVSVTPIVIGQFSITGSTSAAAKNCFINTTANIVISTATNQYAINGGVWIGSGANSLTIQQGYSCNGVKFYNWGALSLLGSNKLLEGTCIVQNCNIISTNPAPSSRLFSECVFMEATSITITGWSSAVYAFSTCVISCTGAISIAATANVSLFYNYCAIDVNTLSKIYFSSSGTVKVFDTMTITGNSFKLTNDSDMALVGSSITIYSGSANQIEPIIYKDNIGATLTAIAFWEMAPSNTGDWTLTNANFTTYGQLSLAANGVAVFDFQPEVPVKSFDDVTIAGASAPTAEFSYSPDGGASWGAWTALTDANLIAITTSNNMNDILRIRFSDVAGGKDVTSLQINFTYTTPYASSTTTGAALALLLGRLGVPADTIANDLIAVASDVTDIHTMLPLGASYLKGGENFNGVIDVTDLALIKAEADAAVADILADTNEIQLAIPVGGIADEANAAANTAAIQGDIATAQADITDILADTDEIQGKLPTNNIMGSSDTEDHDTDIDLILEDTNEMQGKLPAGTIADEVNATANTVAVGAAITASEGVITGDIAALDAKIDILDTVADGIDAVVKDNQDMLSNDRVITGNQEIFYEDDGVTPLRTYDLFNTDGDPAEEDVTERRLV